MSFFYLMNKGSNPATYGELKDLLKGVSSRINTAHPAHVSGSLHDLFPGGTGTQGKYWLKEWDDFFSTSFPLFKTP
jgi:hypothetical protein